VSIGKAFNNSAITNDGDKSIKKKDRKKTKSWVKKPEREYRQNHSSLSPNGAAEILKLNFQQISFEIAYFDDSYVRWVL